MLINADKLYKIKYIFYIFHLHFQAFYHRFSTFLSFSLKDKLTDFMAFSDAVSEALYVLRQFSTLGCLDAALFVLKTASVSAVVEHSNQTLHSESLHL